MTWATVVWRLFLTADGWSWRSTFSGLASQEGVIRLAIITLALGLFIMLKK